MDFKTFFCVNCGQIRGPSEMCFIRECSHFFCLSCLGHSRICLKCGKGKSVFVESEESLTSILSFVTDIYCLFVNKVNESIINVAETEAESVPDKLLVEGDIPDVTLPSLRRTSRNVKSGESENKVQPARKRRKPSESPSCEKNNCERKNASLIISKVKRRIRPFGESNGSVELNVTSTLPIVKESAIDTPKGKKGIQKVVPISPKTNKKGESALHIAVARKNTQLVEELLNNGADPNFQDFAGWTPLHDAVKNEHEEIIMCLLKGGALADVPGFESDTALHIAVEKLNKRIVSTLVKHGGNPHAKNLYGLTPLELAEKTGDKEMINLLLTQTSRSQMKATSSARNEPILLFIGLIKKDEQSKVLQFTKKFKIKVERDIFKASCVVVSSCETSFDWSLARVIAKGSQIISMGWCERSLAMNRLEDMEEYLLHPQWLPGLALAQNNAKLRRPGLFSGCEFKIGLSPQMLNKAAKYEWNETTIDLNDLCLFVKAADGKVINRMPDPENPFHPNTVPYHVQPGPMERCSQIVIYFPGLWEPTVKFNMGHVKCLPVKWLMDCIASFKLISDTQCYFG